MNKDQASVVADAMLRNKTEVDRPGGGAVPTNGARNREWRLAYLLAAVGFACTGCVTYLTANDPSFGALWLLSFFGALAGLLAGSVVIFVRRVLTVRASERAARAA